MVLFIFTFDVLLCMIKTRRIRSTVAKAERKKYRFYVNVSLLKHQITHTEQTNSQAKEKKRLKLKQSMSLYKCVAIKIKTKKNLVK